ncbi:RIB43A-like with coiled-coils protein 1 [Electrophorus electricus]|uniref:RIB43A-like with coiled-coils protein 1 n=1 Tax=Electrophorus electricus TaxID=8005 RepID=UPI0015D0045D|nr:RIB43A-like with coiled-coils protein 1 [Electrophorus electricus]
MHKVDLPVDEAAVEAVRRRRSAEAARQTRIFSTRNRVMGLDLHALERQVAERRERVAMDKQRDMAHDALRVSFDEMLMRQQKEEEDMRRGLARDLVQYRAMHQRAEDSREADLKCNHQGALGVDVSAPESFGPASMQVFQGEGVGEDERKRAQMEMNERVLRAQREERDKQKREYKHKELLRCRELLQHDLRVAQLDALETECKRAACIALKSYNQAQAEERLEREKQDKLRQEEEGLAEMLHMVTSDLLTECPEAAVRAGAAPRVPPDHWKGMGPAQLSAIYRQSEEQRAERERHTQLERQREKAWDLLQLQQARQQVEEESRVRETEKERRGKLDRYNQQLAKEQRAHQQYLKTELYTNQPAAHYFTQFSTSSR